MVVTYDDVELVREEATDPHESLARHRDQASVAFMPEYGSWLVTGHLVTQTYDRHGFR